MAESRITDYDNIRPFYDEEVPDVIARVMANPDLPPAATKLVMPEFLHGTRLGEFLTHHLLKLRTRELSSVYDCQMFIAPYFTKLVDTTIAEMQVSGLEELDRDERYLFISNHRDIVMDSSLLNYQLHLNQHATSRMAVGDNLLTNELAADLMRLNKSFVVERDVTGAKATLKVMHRTSGYIRHSLEEQVSIWIAQKEGRAKDGLDRTEPALIKMLALAHRDDSEDALNALFERCKVIPVSVSYELDPCALPKAHELYVVDTQGHYDKSAEEDVQSIVMGLVGRKGRVHLRIGERIRGPFESPEEAATALDRAIVSGMQVFPTHVDAARQLGITDVPDPQVPELARVMKHYQNQINAIPEEERPYLLRQYANLLVNKAQLAD
ncbi:MAG: 1-acyl-sn-glycerol-3-phosphate acyltransferase [Pseudomonadota bacterium]